MTSVLDILDNFVSGQLASALTTPIPPDPNTLGNYSPDLSGLSRDGDQIIMQWQDKCGNIPGPDLDGGDSAHRVGAAAFCNSAIDKGLLHKFENGHGMMVRHPSQVPWNETNNCTLDQLKGYSVGCWRAGQTQITRRLLEQHALRNWKCQNIFAPDRCPIARHPAKLPDALQPDEIMSLRISAGDSEAYLDPVAQFWLSAAIQLTDIDAKASNPNLLFESILCGRLNLFVTVHPNYRDQLRNYWGPNRQMKMAEAIIEVVDLELKRYPKTPVLLLPRNQIDLLKSLNWRNELKNIDPAHHTKLMGQFAQAALRDAANVFVQVGNSVADAIKRLKSLSPQATATQIATAVRDAKTGKPADVIHAGLTAAGFAANQVNQAMQAVFSTVAPGVKLPIPPLTPPDPGKIVQEAKKRLPDLKKIIPKIDIKKPFG